MRILAIDTALPAASACVFDAAATEPAALESLAMERGHAEALLPLIERVVERAGGFATIERVAVAVGPGSFTGIRIGLAAAHAIALARKIDIVGVSTLSALAAPHILEPFEGAIVSAIDARHGQIFVAAFGADGRALLAPRRASPAEALAELGDMPLSVVGSGAQLFAAEAAKNDRPVAILDERAAPDILFVAKLGLVAQAETAPARPLYLKAPDAKPLPGRVAELEGAV